MTYEIGQATVLLWQSNEKQAADAELSYGLKGKLYLSKSGWILMQVPNALARGAFDALGETGVELPPSGPDEAFNAHVSVMRPEELERIGGAERVTERGHDISYTLGPVRCVEPAGWSEMSKVWFIEVRSPELEQLRKSYGLSGKPNEDKFNFHISFAVRRKNVTRNHEATKQLLPLADIIHKPQQFFKDKYHTSGSGKQSLPAGLPKVAVDLAAVKTVGDTLLKAATDIAELKQVKEHSDRGQFAAKAHALRKLITDSPQDWDVEEAGQKHRGVKHRRTGFRYHMPSVAVPTIKTGSVLDDIDTAAADTDTGASAAQKEYTRGKEAIWEGTANRIQDLVSDAHALPVADASAVCGLRGARDPGLPQMVAEFRDVFSGHGTKTAGAYPGSAQQRRPLHAAQLSLGDANATNEKHAQLPHAALSGAEDGAGRVGRGARTASRHIDGQVKQRMVIGQIVKYAGSRSGNVQATPFQNLSNVSGAKSTPPRLGDYHGAGMDLHSQTLGSWLVDQTGTNHAVKQAGELMSPVESQECTARAAMEYVARLGESLHDASRRRPEDVTADGVVKSARSFYLDAVKQVPLNLSQGPVSYLQSIKDRGDRGIREATNADRLKLEIASQSNPNAQLQRLQQILSGQRAPLVSHPLDRVLSGT